MINNFYKNKRILVTGGAGFLGQCVAREIASRGALLAPAARRAGALALARRDGLGAVRGLGLGCRGRRRLHLRCGRRAPRASGARPRGRSGLRGSRLLVGASDAPVPARSGRWWGAPGARASSSPGTSQVTSTIPPPCFGARAISPHISKRNITLPIQQIRFCSLEF